MTIKLTLAAVLLSLSYSATAAVTMSVPEDIVLLQVNDKDVNAGLLRKKITHYQLDAGNNQLIVRYQGFFEHSNGDHDIAKSNAVQFVTPALQDGGHYSLAWVNAPRNYEQAVEYAKQPKLGLYNAKKQLIAEQTAIYTEQQPWFGHKFLSSTIDLTRDKPSSQAMVGSQSKDNSKQVMPVVDQSKVNSDVTFDANQQLVKLWKQSSPSERQNFLRWLSTQSQ